MSNSVSKKQQRLKAIMKVGYDGPIRVADAMRILEVDRQQASKLLAGWCKQGALQRISHGVYFPASPLGFTQVDMEPLSLIPELYAPGYYGGWNALNDWDLTEQLFNVYCVLTSKRVRYGERKHLFRRYSVHYVPEKHHFGTTTIRWEHIKIQMSDPYKTILDCINDVNLAGGVQHLTYCINEFTKVYGKPSDYHVLLDYAIRFNNGALFKKLGYFAELFEFGESFVNECRKRITSGYAALDKDPEIDMLITRWNLWVPKYMVHYQSWLYGN